MKYFTFMLGLVFLSTGLWADNDQVVKVLNLEADGLKSLMIRNGSGTLEIYGEKDRKTVETELIFHLPDRMSEEEADRYIRRYTEVYTERDNDRGTVYAVNKGSWNWRKGLSIEMIVYVPHGVDLIVDDGSGSMTIQKVRGNLDVKDGSGSMEISDVVGNIRVDDGSGSASIDRVDGDVRIDDGSGSIDIEDITGTVTVDDGSGGITVRDVGGDVVILDDGSGGLSISQVKGRVDRRD